MDHKVHLPRKSSHVIVFFYANTFPLLFSSGGVVLASIDGKIVFENTLDARLDVAFRNKLPEVLSLITLQ